MSSSTINNSHTSLAIDCEILRLPTVERGQPSLTEKVFDWEVAWKQLDQDPVLGGIFGKSSCKYLS
jgi:hypothetical protein